MVLCVCWMCKKPVACQHIHSNQFIRWSFHCFVYSLFRCLFLNLPDVALSTPDLLIQARSSTKITRRDVLATFQQHLFSSSTSAIPFLLARANRETTDTPLLCCCLLLGHRYTPTQTHMLHTAESSYLRTNTNPQKAGSREKYCISGVFLPHRAFHCCLGSFHWGTGC